VRPDRLFEEAMIPERYGFFCGVPVRDQSGEAFASAKKDKAPSAM
jgi:hypothetical protein